MTASIHWGPALITLVGFGLGMGVNPALYGAMADMLARNVQAMAKLWWMLAGLAVGATLLLLIFHSFNPASIVAASKGKVDALLVNQTVDTVAAVVFVLAAIVVLLWKRRIPVLPVKPKRAPKPGARPFNYFFLGLGACIGFTTIPIMYLTGRLIAGVTSDLLLRGLAYGVFLAALAAPFLAVAWVWSRIPKLSDRITHFYASAQGWDYRIALTVLLAATGAFFLWLAFFDPLLR